MRYTLINPQGFETSISIEEEQFTKPIVLLPGATEPTSYEAMGWLLGFSDDNERRPHSDRSVPALEKGAKALAEQAAGLGVATTIGPQQQPEPQTPKQVAAEVRKASGPTNPAANKTAARV